jgi:hypothetical protein
MAMKRIVKPIFCPNASRIGYDRYAVKHGDLIRFSTSANDGSKIHSLGRVLGCAVRDGMGQPYKARKVLLVLKASDDLSHGYLFHVPIETVEQIFDPGAFTRWFLFGVMPDESSRIEHLSDLGVMGNSYIADYLDWKTGGLVADPRAVWRAKYHG